jgi:hypothetical protein
MMVLLLKYIDIKLVKPAPATLAPGLVNFQRNARALMDQLGQYHPSLLQRRPSVSSVFAEEPWISRCDSMSGFSTKCTCCLPDRGL